jgi:hypothetical protein
MYISLEFFGSQIERDVTGRKGIRGYNIKAAARLTVDKRRVSPESSYFRAVGVALWVLHEAPTLDALRDAHK